MGGGKTIQHRLTRVPPQTPRGSRFYGSVEGCHGSAINCSAVISVLSDPESQPASSLMGCRKDRPTPTISSPPTNLLSNALLRHRGGLPWWCEQLLSCHLDV